MDDFGDIFWIIIVGGSIVWEVIKSLKGDSEDTKENFPEIPVPVSEEMEEGVAVEEVHPLKEREASIEVSEKRRRIEQILAMLGKPCPPQSKPTPQPIASTPKRTKVLESTNKPLHRQKSSINHELHSVKAARKAFIYSEIFKKKYE